MHKHLVMLSYIADSWQRVSEHTCQAALKGALTLVEKDVVPDFLIRLGTRFVLADRLAQEQKGGEEVYQERLQHFVDELKRSPIAIQTATANEQHYEIPTEYFILCLGKHLKYSSCLFPKLDPATPLHEAEEAMLELSCSRAELKDGQDVLELGCGWGSLCLYISKRFPNSRVTAISNSRTQKEFIDARCKERGLSNLRVITADVVTFDTHELFDRVLSIEMFEHMKNYQALMAKIARWLKSGGQLFVHHFSHKKYPYHFEGNWMAENFFSGGTMPSANLLHHFQDELVIKKQWFINGRHYSLTLEAWLAKQDAQRKVVMPIMKDTYGESDALKWWVRWRLFYIICSESFKYNGGNEWGVTHILFSKR